MAKKIPNFNSFSTIIDRLSIENVKLSHFENVVNHDNPGEKERAEFQRKIEVQREIIDILKGELVAFMEGVFLEGRYDVVKEERTFK